MHATERPGTGTVAVCIHGFCQSSLFWVPTLDRLSEAGIAGMAPDLPGFGESAGLPGPWTLEAYADGLATLLDRKGLDRVCVVGGSMGGAVAQHFATLTDDGHSHVFTLGIGDVAPGPPPCPPGEWWLKVEA